MTGFAALTAPATHDLRMELLYIAVGFIALGLVLKVLSGKRPARHNQYQAASLLTRGEQAFAYTLEPVLPPGTRLLAKVRVADVITPNSPRDRAAFLRISQKHIDFVIADQNWKTLAAIELNDKSHNKPARVARDEFLRDAFANAGIALHFVRAQSRYDAAELTRLLRADTVADLPHMRA